MPCTHVYYGVADELTQDRFSRGREREREEGGGGYGRPTFC